ncbi:uncharacterized protein LOC133179471 [Saccostrea echinata]|uniref:uncharacterized protein LOC133179471 n=1 Tax=Saccostrea echinata TaxID=191078 RepID=UPI002A80C195|nr:uncharacterized protein LOC133179471 [Saccostrea echinata]XP_061170213.1 uncharacterized protein LOC133179471 [Saccostrea echinata]
MTVHRKNILKMLANQEPRAHTEIVPMDFLRQRPKSATMRLKNIDTSLSDHRITFPTVKSAVSQFVQINSRNRSAGTRTLAVSLPDPESQCEQTLVENTGVRMRYTHGIPSDADLLSKERQQTMTQLYHELAMDSVDVVFDANDPESRRSCSPKKIIAGSPALLGMQAQIHSLTESFARRCKIPKSRSLPESACFHSIQTMTSPEMHQSVTGQDTNRENYKTKDDVNTDYEKLPPVITPHLNGNETPLLKDYGTDRRHTCKKKVTKSKQNKKNKKKETDDHHDFVVTDGIINPDIHRDAYIRALQDARSKYFRKTTPDSLVTEPYKFSYFDVTNKNERGRPPKDRDFRNYVGMKRIFGDIRLDDYYSLRYTGKYISKKPEVRTLLKDNVQ